MKKLKLGLLIIVGVFLVTACSCSKQKYTVTFDSNGGSSVSAQTVKKGGTASKPNDPTRSGYIFDGWYVNLTDSSSYNFSKKVTSNLKLKAKWEKVEDSYTISFDSDGGNSVSSIKVGSGSVSLPTPTRDGYKFLGWYYNDKKITNVSDITTDMKLTAKWEKVESTTEETKKDESTKKTSSSKTTTKTTKTTKKTSTSTNTNTSSNTSSSSNTSTNSSSNTSNTSTPTQNTISYEIVDVESSTVGQVRIYLLKNNKRVSGTADITTTTGNVVNKAITADGYMTNGGNIKSVTNIKVD